MAIRAGWRPTTLPLQTRNQYEHIVFLLGTWVRQHAFTK